MISIQNFSFQYHHTQSNCLNNIHLNIQDGECVLLCGRSGCGKTTIIRLINGLIPQFYQGKMNGKVQIDGKDIFQIPMYELSKKIGSVFQNPRTQFFNIDVDSEIAFGIENQGMPENQIQQRVQSTMTDLHIEDLSGLKLHDLSGGEKQKIAFASTYAMDNDIYLLDEPSSHLDHQATKSLHDYIQILKNKKKTIVIAEHRLYYLIDLVDKIVYMDHGKIQIYTPHGLMNLSIQQRKKMGLRTLSLQDLTWTQKTKKSSDYATLVFDRLSLFYQQKCVLQDISLQARRGEVIGVIGANGVGKSTFSRSICGLHKKKTGDILWEGQKKNDKECMRLSYMVMQDVNYQLFADSVYEECCLGIKDPHQQIIEETLDILDLQEYRDCHPNTLSGGQKQRVAVAVSMICQKDLLVFDEPTSGLDYDSMQQVSDFIQKVAQMGKVVFVVTHDYEFLCQCCYRVLHFDKGRLCHDLIMNEDSKPLLNHLFQI